MRVAVLTLTRDRLAYTQHCFAKLAENAGCEFDHFVLDQGSTDETPRWLDDEFHRFGALVLKSENVGISRGMNDLLAQIDLTPYDVVVKFDNDCELTTPNTLRDIATLVHENPNLLLSPQIHGLNAPPPTIMARPVDGHTIHFKNQIGGIFLAAPAALYTDFRYDENNPTWGMDDVQVCRHWRSQGGWCGYVQGYDANHYETTAGQHERFPDYFATKRAEGLPA